MKKEKSSKCNSSIKCDVETCKYNDNEEEKCTLEEIKVSCTCDNCDCTNKDETICKSFKEVDSDEDDDDEDEDIEVEISEEEIEEQ